MKIKGNTIFLLSDLHYYRKEEDGRKPNTTRIIEQRENSIITVVNPKRIQIILSSGPPIQQFEREITDISHIATICGKAMITISWKHPELEEEPTK